MPRTAALLLGVTLLLAGCTGAPLPGQDDPTPTDRSPEESPTNDPTETPTATPTVTPTPIVDGTPTDYPPGQAPDADHDLIVENRLDGNATVDLRVVREATNGTVYDESVTVEPGERTVYNTEQVDPDGDEAFQVVAERGDQTDAETIRMTECYGDVIVSPTEDGGIQVIYSIC